MRVRAKANGNIVEVDDEQGHALIGTGIYETVDVRPEPSAEKPKNRPPDAKATRPYRRRDMRAEE